MISITVPVFNERESLPLLLAALKGVLDRSPREWEVVFVNDGSSDGSDSWCSTIWPKTTPG
jgi:glycosyltransferase involved in cell wall biosynthesis